MTLMRAALISAIGEWSTRVEAVLSSVADPSVEPLERFQIIWARVLEVFEQDRALWAASFEVIAARALVLLRDVPPISAPVDDEDAVSHPASGVPVTSEARTSANDRTKDLR